MTPQEYILLLQELVSQRNASSYSWSNYLKTRNSPQYVDIEEPYLAAVLHKPWYDEKICSYIIFFEDFQKPEAAKMTQQEALDNLKYLLQERPQIAAWLTLETLQVALNLRWTNMIIFLTFLLEQRNQWFTPAGFYSHLAERVDYTEREKRLDTPLIATQGEWNIPKYLYLQDSGSINFTHSVEKWLKEAMEKENDETLQNLITLLTRAWTSNSKQWTIEECESFHAITHHKILGMVAHARDDSNQNFSTLTSAMCGNTQFSQEVKWHSNLTTSLCQICHKHQQEVYKKFLTLQVERQFYQRLSFEEYLSMINSFSPYQANQAFELMLTQAAKLRRARLRGLLFCGVKLIIKARLIHYIPGIGRFYFEAMQRLYQRNYLKK